MENGVPYPCDRCKSKPEQCTGKGCERWIDWFYDKWNAVCKPLRRKESKDE